MGTFASGADVDIHAFKVESNFTVSAEGRPICLFDLWAPPGPEGSGSTTEDGFIVRIAEASAPNMALASVDMTSYDWTFGYPEMPSIAVPCEKGKDYLIFLTRPEGATAGENDFYFYSHVQAGSGRVEAEPNDATPQQLQLSPTSDMTGHRASITGNIAKAGDGGDVDIFSVNVPAGMTRASAFCTAERSGSGLRALQVSLLDGADNFLQNGSGAEGADQMLYIDGARVPEGASVVKMRVIADAQDPAVSGTYYYCTLLLDGE